MKSDVVMSDVNHRIDELEQQLEKMWIYIEKVEDRAVGFIRT
jgi:hypothetical protein